MGSCLARDIGSRCAGVESKPNPVGILRLCSEAMTVIRVKVVSGNFVWGNMQAPVRGEAFGWRRSSKTAAFLTIVSVRRTSRQGVRMKSVLERVHQRARRNKKEQFTALLHQSTEG